MPGAPSQQRFADFGDARERPASAGVSASPEPPSRAPPRARSRLFSPQAPEREGELPEDAAPALERERGRGKGQGWLGGLFTKLSLRPPNQMILPDDKNPSVSVPASSPGFTDVPTLL